VLAAPAGHGKTFLAAQLAAVAPGPTAWFTADELDRDVAGVVTQLLAALGRAWPDLADLVPSTLDDDVALPLLGTALEMLAGPGCLVIDDAHRLPTGVFEAVARTAIHALPPECRLVVCTRHGAPEPLVRAEAAGVAVTLGPDDLVFTAAECAQLHDVTSADGADLLARTGGWPLAVALAPEARLSGIAGSGTGGRRVRHAGVLAGVALGGLPPDARDVLAVLARLPHFPGALLTELGNESRWAIESLANRHPSILQRPDDGWWVVREWLSDALRAWPVPPVTHAAVCAALRRLDERELVVHLLLSDGRHDEAVADVEHLARAGARLRRWGWVRALIATLPPPARTWDLDLIAANAAHSLNLVEEADRLDGDGDRDAADLVSERSLVDLVQRAVDSGTSEQRLRAQALLADHYRLMGDYRVLQVCEQALGDALHPADPEPDLVARWPSAEAEAAGKLLRIYGMALLVAPDGDVVHRGRQLLAASIELLDRHGAGLSERIWSVYTEALLWLRTAEEAIVVVRPGARRLEQLDQFDAAVRLGELAILEYFAGDVAAARHTIEIARECADRTGNTIVEAPLDAIEAVLDVAADGLSTERVERFDAACARFVRHPRLIAFTSPFAAEMAMQLVWHGERVAARRYLEQAEAGRGTSIFTHIVSLNCGRVRGLLLMAEGDVAAGADLLENIRTTAAAERRTAIVERINADEARLRSGLTATPPARATDTAVIVRVLGPTLRVDIAGEPAPPPRGYPARLLALLVARGGVMTVDAAIEGLWPAADPDLGRNRLYGVLLRLRRGLGLPVDGPIRCIEGLVRLERSDALDIDSWAFDRAAVDAGRDPRLRLDAIDRYTGDVLSEQFAYDDVITGYRAQLRHRFLGLATAVLDDRSGEADVDRRTELARQVAHRAPEDEALCRAATRVLVDAGHPTEARNLVDITARALGDLGLDGDAFRAGALADLSDRPR
jgi:DNA-binding SARP family transcriptional activator